MIYAVGVIEIKSIAKGVEACDDALKAANVRLILTNSGRVVLKHTKTPKSKAPRLSISSAPGTR